MAGPTQQKIQVIVEQHQDIIYDVGVGLIIAILGLVIVGMWRKIRGRQRQAEKREHNTRP